jgi:hypothetical protein
MLLRRYECCPEGKVGQEGEVKMFARNGTQGYSERFYIHEGNETGNH